MRSAWLALVLVLVAGCSRSFQAPKAASGATPSLDAIDAGPGAFAGQTVLLSGQSFSPQAEVDQVRVGTALAAVIPDGGASATELSIAVPDLGPGAQDVPVTVTVDGRTSNAQTLHYRGPGHPSAFSLVFGSDLSPTPTSTTGIEGQLLVSLLRNTVFGLELPQLGQELDFAAGPNALPFGTAVVLGSNQLGGVAVSQQLDLAIWTAEVSFGTGAPVSTLRTNQGGAWSTLASTEMVGASPSHLDPFSFALPTPSGLVLYSPDGGPAEPGPGLYPRAPGQVALAGAMNVYLSGTGVAVGAALYTDDAGAPMLDRFLVQQGSPPIFRNPVPVVPSQRVGNAKPASDRLSLTFDGDAGIAAYFVANGVNGAVAISVDYETGAMTTVGEPLGFRADALAASVGHLAITGQTNLQAVILRRDGGLESAVPLDGPPYTVSADMAIPDRFYVTVVSPPEVVVVDGQSGQVVEKVQLYNQLDVGPLDPTGAHVAVSAIKHPALAVLDTGTLIEDAAGFQHAAGAGEPDLAVPVSLAWRPAQGGGEELCGAVQQLAFGDGGADEVTVQSELRCAPPDAFFSGGCTLSSTAPASVADAGMEPAVLMPLADGRLRMLAGGVVSDCGSCSQGCSQVGTYPVPPEDVGSKGTLLLPDGDVIFVGQDRSLQRLTPGGSPQVLCTSQLGPCVEPQAAGLVADPDGRWVAIIGHDFKVVDLARGQVAAQTQYFSDIPLSAAFSADGTRLYVGTVLGHVDEYDLRKLDPTGQMPMTPSRRLSTGFSVVQITPYPDGSRLLLTDLNSDRLFVVQ